MKQIREMGMGELAAYVCSHLGDNGIHVVLSGGACVAVHSEGRYVSDDLDFIENISSSRRRLKKVLAAIGFEEQGRYFLHPDTAFFLEFPPGPLAVGEGPTGSLVPLARPGVSGTSPSGGRSREHRPRGNRALGSQRTDG